MIDIDSSVYEDFLNLDVSNLKNIASQCSYSLPATISQSDNFSILHINARSIKNKFDEVQNLLAGSGVGWSVICISESWLKNYHISSYAIDKYHMFASCREQGEGGGTLIYVREHIDVKERRDLETNLLETTFVEIKTPTLNNKNIIIGNIYRPPSLPHNLFLEYIENLLDVLEMENKMVILCGDFNYNLLDMRHDNNVLNFNNLLSAYCYFPTIFKPTRIQNEKQSILDNFYINELSYHDKSGVFIDDLSDHLPIYLSLTVKDSIAKQKRTRKVFDKTKTPQFRKFLSSKLQNFQNHKDANEACSELIGCYMEGIDKYSKNIQTSTRTMALKPWVTPALLCSINKKNKLYKKFLRRPNVENTKRYRQFRNILTKLMRESKRLYYEKSFEETKNNSKKTWDLLNELINKRKTQHDEPPTKFIDSKGNIFENDKVSHGFNEYFSSVGCQLEKNIPPPDSHPLDFLIKPTYQDMNTEMTTNSSEVGNVIKSLNPVGGGIDRVSTEILLLTYRDILHHLTFFFNLCLSNAVFPDMLKIAIIKPIFKTGQRDIFNNYRPISLLPVFSKVLEKILHFHISNYLCDNNVLNEMQFGFRKNCGTYMPIAHLVDDISTSLQESLINCVLYLDLKKAFDTVSFDILLDKLALIGIKGKIHQILKSYLTNRKQRTLVHSYISEDAKIDMGVPQGSILGPLLFIIYMNDLPSISNEAKFYLFADDTAIAVKGQTLSELQNKLDSVLSIVTKWFNANRLSLNVSKTYYQIFSARLINGLDVKINNTKINRKESVKYLGVTIDENLKWQSHINNISSVISRNLGIMGRAKYFISSQHLMLLYNSLILPYLNYCAVVWGTNYSTRIYKLVKLQKRALRIIDKKPYSYHTRELFIKYRILKFPDLVRKQHILILLGYLNGTLPTPIFEMFEYHRLTNTRVAQHFKVPFARTNYKAFSLSVAAPRAWNTIVCKIFKNIDEVPRRKYILKKYVTEYILGQY